MAGVSVFLAMPSHRDLPVKTVASLLETQNALSNHHIDCVFEVQAGSSLVHQARIKTAANFLKSKCTHLFWVDSDITWSGKDFLRLLAFGTKLECVGAIYPAKKEPLTFFINLVDENAEVFPNEYGCLPIRGMGLGFTVVQRKVIEQLADKAPLCAFDNIAGPVPELFRLDHVDRGRIDEATGKVIHDLRGEDMAFFADIADLGYQVWLDPEIKLGHVGQKEYRADPRAFLTQS